jgi:hypothetical protein
MKNVNGALDHFEPKQYRFAFKQLKTWRKKKEQREIDERLFKSKRTNNKVGPLYLLTH